MRLLAFFGFMGLATCMVVGTPAQDERPPAQPEGVEVLARGPVHEAFAALAQERPLPSPVAPKQPPDPIEEVPPAEKPADDHVIWIPGYWAWDDEPKDFLWVSGFWRVPPPDRQWLPGNWQQVEDGWQWTSGFWAAANQEQVTYLPAPPPSVDEGPSTPAPDENSIYVPGCWMHRETRYLWRPGFWLGYQPDWVWSSSHYVWTPGGYVYVDGFWDRPLDRRGLLFAPIRVASSLLGTQWSYAPSYVVQPDFLFGALFARPSYCHYYFGDYFDTSYGRSGFVPWFDYRIGRGSYDSNFAYYRHGHSDPGWERNLRGYYAGRTSGEIPRPPRTLVQQNTVVNNFVNNKTENVNVNKNINITQMQNVNALTAVTKIHDTPVTSLASLDPGRGSGKPGTSQVLKMETMPKAQQAEARKGALDSRAVGQQRHQTEAKILTGGNAPVKASDPPHIVKLQPPQTTPIPPNGQQPSKAKEPAPQPKEPAPKPKAPAPTPKEPAPKPKEPAPTPKEPAPQPKAPAPKPKEPAPTPKEPAPQPKAPAPQPKAPAPQPQSPPPQRLQAPPPPKMPAHVETPIPPHQPPPAAKPPKKG
jgi:hypothetical protein